MDGLYDLGDSLERGRAGALKDVPREVRTQIHTAIDNGLSRAGITREQAASVVRELEQLRTQGVTLAQIERLL